MIRKSVEWFSPRDKRQGRLREIMLKKLLRGAENNTFSGLISRVSPATCRRKIFGSVDFGVAAP
jgi:hypothetical protein